MPPFRLARLLQVSDIKSELCIISLCKTNSSAHVCPSSLLSLRLAFPSKGFNDDFRNSAADSISLPLSHIRCVHFYFQSTV